MQLNDIQATHRNPPVGEKQEKLFHERDSARAAPGFTWRRVRRGALLPGSPESSEDTRLTSEVGARSPMKDYPFQG